MIAPITMCNARKYSRSEISGSAACGSALARAIKLCNHQRKLMADVNALRLAATPRVAGSRMFQITAAAGVMPIAQHIAALQAVLDAALALPPIKGLRLMVKGSAPDDLSLHSLLESIGAVVVADDHANGDGCFVGQVSESGEPLDALAQYYHQVSASPRSLPQSLQDQRFMARAHAAQVQGVVFVVEEHDDTFGWDIPAQKRMLDVGGIPSLCLLHQPYRRNASSSASSENARRTALQDWLASLGTR